MSKSGAAPDIDRADELLLSSRELIAEIQRSRHEKSQPLSALGQMRRDKAAASPFASGAEFLRAVRQCPNGAFEKSQQMKAWMGQLQKALPSGLNETAGADGGYLVPPEFAQQILMRTYQNDLLSRTTLFPLSTSNSIRIPAINETSRADGSRFGGVQAFWRGEGSSVNRTKPRLDLITLTVDSLTCTVQATQELLDDASNMGLEQYINLVVPQELSFKIGDAIVNGDGVNKPKGIINSPSKVTVSAEAGQAAATLNATNVIKMWSRLHVSCRPNAVWLYDQSIEPQLMQMTIGTAGANLAVYLPPGGLSGNPFGTLLGKPMIPVEFCQQLGTEGDLILTDLSTYLTASKGGLQTAMSMHVLFETNELLYRFILRMDGRSWWASSLTPKSGGATQTNVVTLATRP
jgi:HK97 family phage major capsid protein